MKVGVRLAAGFAATVISLIGLGANAANYPDPERYRGAMLEFAAEPAPAAGGIVATGSSSMLGWHNRIDADLAPLSIIKRGFGGSNMFDVRYFLTEFVLRHKPRAVLLYEGDNDVSIGATPAEVLVHFEAIVTGIHVALPQTRIYVVSVKPSISRWQLWPTMTRTNSLLKAFCDNDSRLTYVDVASPMLGGDGTPLPEVFVEDNLHMNGGGYDIWRDVVRPVLLHKEARHEVKTTD